MQRLEEYLIDNPKKYLLVDFDHTLFDLHLPWHIYHKQMRAAMEELDSSLPDFHNITELENEATRRHGEMAAKIRREISHKFESEYLEDVTELTDLTDFVRQNDQYTYYLWTSNMEETVKPILERTDLIDSFKKLITKSSVLLLKPEPEGFYQVFDDRTQQKSEYLLIGDSSYDEGAADSAEIDFFRRP